MWGDEVRSSDKSGRSLSAVVVVGGVMGMSLAISGCWMVVSRALVPQRRSMALVCVWGGNVGCVDKQKGNVN